MSNLEFLHQRLRPSGDDINVKWFPLTAQNANFDKQYLFRETRGMWLEYYQKLNLEKRNNCYANTTVHFLCQIYREINCQFQLNLPHNIRIVKKNIVLELSIPNTSYKFNR